MLSISFKSHLIRHSGMERAFKDTQRTLEPLTKALREHSGGWALEGHSEDTQRALEHLGTRRALKRALGEHSQGTWVLEHLRHLGTRALRALY